MTEAKKVTLTLDEELHNFILAKIEDGQFASVGEYVNAVLREEQKLVRERQNGMAQQSVLQRTGA